MYLLEHDDVKLVDLAEGLMKALSAPASVSMADFLPRDFLGRLGGSRHAESRDDDSTCSLEAEVPSELLPAAGQLCVCIGLAHLRLLQRMQAPL